MTDKKKKARKVFVIRKKESPTSEQVATAEKETKPAVTVGKKSTTAPSSTPIWVSPKLHEYQQCLLMNPIDPEGYMAVAKVLWHEDLRDPRAGVYIHPVIQSSQCYHHLIRNVSDIVMLTPAGDRVHNPYLIPGIYLSALKASLGIPPTKEPGEPFTEAELASLSEKAEELFRGYSFKVSGTCKKCGGDTVIDLIQEESYSLRCRKCGKVKTRRRKDGGGSDEPQAKDRCAGGSQKSSASDKKVSGSVRPGKKLKIRPSKTRPPEDSGGGSAKSTRTEGKKQKGKGKQIDNVRGSDRSSGPGTDTKDPKPGKKPKRFTIRRSK